MLTNLLSVGYTGTSQGGILDTASVEAAPKPQRTSNNFFQRLCLIWSDAPIGRMASSVKSLIKNKSVSSFENAMITV